MKSVGPLERSCVTDGGAVVDHDEIWHLFRDGKQYGPYRFETLVESARKCVLQNHDQVWRPGWDSWQSAHLVPGLYALGPVIGGEDPSQPPEQSDLPETESFGSRRKLIAGTAIVMALGIAAFAYFFLASAGGKTPTQTAEPAPPVESSPVAQVQAAAPSMPELSSAPPAAAWIDLPASVTAPQPLNPVEAPPQVASAALTENTAVRQTVPASQNRDVVFLQRPGVNIRSTPSATGSVLGTAPKGTRFAVTNREGDWVQVESGRLKGWINSQFLAANEHR